MNKKYYRFILTFFVSAPFSALMSFVGVVRSGGFTDETFSRWFLTWLIMLPIAYIAALAIVPLAKLIRDKLPWRM